MARVARDLRQPSQAWLVGAHEALLALFAGSLEEAERLVEAARDLGERTQGWNATVTHRLQLYALRREQDRLGEIEDLIRRSVAEFPTYPIVRCVQTHVLAALGAHDEARAALETLTRGRCAALPFDEEWLVSTCLLADAAVALGASRSSTVLYELLAPYDDHVAISYPEVSIGAVALRLGALAATTGRGDDARRHFADALAMHDRIGAHRWHARTEREAARLLGPG